MPKLLDTINSPADLKQLAPAALEELAAEIRQEIIKTVTVTGGHLASNLGVVELTIALHRVFDSPKDKIIWDVGHQSYVHKLLTGRKNRFDTLRQYGGLSGFTCRDESPHDPFGAGHASTSVSAAMGMVVARDLAGEDYDVVAVIGDGAITAGMSFEALNQAGNLGSRLFVILNDNGMSISPSVGALAKLLSRVRLNRPLRRVEKSSKKILAAFSWGRKLAEFGEFLVGRFKGLVIPTPLWEALGFTYIGPIDGHSIRDMEHFLTQVKNTRTKPTLIHVVTTKGKGHTPAENDAVYFHGVAAKGGGSNGIQTYSEVFAQTTLRLAREEPKLLVITPAMPEGNCLNIVEAEFPNRVFDVGICEQHAVTFAAGLATQGYIPVVAIYSTFLQRAFDQMIHDVCLQDLPVVFAIDRGGIVGDDGKTHQGIFDISYLTLVPNMIVAAPKDENELQHLLYTAVKAKHPMAVRYPRSPGLGVPLDADLHEIPIGKGEVVREGADVALIALGASVSPAVEAAQKLASKGIEAAVVNARFAKPLDKTLITDQAGRIKNIVTVEENVLRGGFGESVIKLLEESGICDIKVRNIGIPDEFVEHGTQSVLRAKYGLDADGIARQVTEMLSAKNEDFFMKDKDRARTTQ
jgi:1-deoxy-D-xylulose-5-phosphate synthase